MFSRRSQGPAGDHNGLDDDGQRVFRHHRLAFYPMTPFSLNVTAAPQGSLPWLTAWPADLPYPYVSTLNATDGNMTANAAIVQAKSSGNLALAAGSATDVFVDINGYFAPPATGGLYFYPIPPCRVVAAKNVQSQQNYAVLNGQCPIPATAQAYSFNATAAPKNDALWQLSIWLPSADIGECPVNGLHAFYGRERLPNQRDRSPLRHRRRRSRGRGPGVSEARRILERVVESASGVTRSYQLSIPI